MPRFVSPLRLEEDPVLGGGDLFEEIEQIHAAEPADNDTIYYREEEEEEELGGDFNFAFSVVDERPEVKEEEDEEVKIEEEEENEVKMEEEEENEEEEVKEEVHSAELDHDYAPPTASAAARKSSRAAAAKRGKKTRRGRRKPKANAWSHGTAEKLKEASETKERPKLYEQTPFADPELERCRRNALCAKANRERKRREQQALRREVALMREEMARARADLARVGAENEGLRSALGRVATALRTRGLEGLVKAVACRDHHATPEERAACFGCSLDAEE